MSYTSLHGHTEYSNLRLVDSISTPQQVLDKAHDLKLNGLAITDHESLSSFITAEHYLTKMKEENPNDEIWQNLKFIRGNEIYLCRNGLNKDNYVRGVDRFFHFILLAKDYIGYLQLCELSSRAWRRAYKYFQVRVPTYYQDLIEVVGANPGHVIASSACIGGQIGQKFIQSLKGEISYDEAIAFNTAWINRLKEIVGEENFFLEMQPGVTEEQTLTNKGIIELSKVTNTPFIITTDHHYTNREDREVHKAYLNSSDGDREVDSFYEATYMMSTEEIHSRLDSQIGYENVEEAFKNTNLICDRIEEYSLLKSLEIPYLPQKRFDIPVLQDSKKIEIMKKQIPSSEYYFDSKENADHQFISRLADFLFKEENGVIRIFDEKRANRTNTELQIIWDAGKKLNVAWSKYFLQVADYINIYWTLGDSIICPSRGSAGASYVCYALGIIQIDPVKESAPLIFERFMNPDRASVLDVDIDIQSNRRNRCIDALKSVYGEERVTRVSTFRTESSRAAVQTAARALKIDVDIGRYISSLIGEERGIKYTLSQTYYGDEENGIKPNATFRKEMDARPQLWKVAQKIEGLICGLGSHAGGVIMTEEPITNTCGVMRTSSGDLVTAYDLHQVEDMSLIKIDLLATEGLTKIRTCLDLLCEYGYVEKERTLKDTYEKVIGVYNLDRSDNKMWEMVWNNEITSLFQMEQQSGIQGIALTHPHSLEDLATLNSVIRLMPPDKNSERPLEKFARFRVNKDEWDKEMDEYGLTEEEKQLLHGMFDYSNGISAQQEDLYQLMRCDKIVGYSFGKADKLRKCIAKKNPKEYQAFEKQFWEDVRERKSSPNLCNYIWNVLVATQRGYSFNLAHTLSYSIVALQEMNLSRYYPIIFWNTANLIVDSGAEFTLSDDEQEDLLIDELEENSEEKGNSTSNYGKIASAIGKMQNRGIRVLPPDINESKFTYTPNVEENTIRYGLKGIIGVGDNVIEEIMRNRPYDSVFDFLERVHVNKTQMINLIKCGAFDCFGDRIGIMLDYVDLIAETKKDLNLRNVNMLIVHELIPDEYDLQRRVFNFNKYITKAKDKKTELISLDEIAYPFYEKHFDLDLLTPEEDHFVIPAKTWKSKCYDPHMDILRTFIKENKADLLEKLNNDLRKAVLDKYCKGTPDKWSMDSVCFYQDKHELEGIDLSEYGVQDFWDLPEEPQVDYSFSAKDGHIVNMFKLTRIAGTVIDKNKNKKQITLLTTKGVVIVQAYGVMPQYDKQISMVGKDGVKHVVEKSWFTRGNKIIVNGMRRGENIFVAKKYNKQPGHHFMLIKDIDEKGNIELQEERFEVSEN